MSGDVGAQYSPAAGWAQAIQYRSRVLQEAGWQGAMAAALGGDGSTAANGFWAALNIATTLRLPMLFFIEDNAYAISVPSHLQNAQANIADSLASFPNLRVLQGDGTDPPDAAEKIAQAVDFVRAGQGPCLLRLRRVFCPFPKSNSANTWTPPPSRSTTPAGCAGARPASSRRQ